MSTLRKVPRLLLVVGALALVLAAGIWLGRGPLHKGQATTTPAPAPAKADEGRGVVIVDAKAQSRSAITTAPLEKTTYRSEFTAYGIVVDLQPLLALRTRHATAAAETSSAETAVKASRDEYERNRMLFADDRNVSLKAVETAEATYRADQAKLQSASATLREVGAAARHQFGEVLERWAFDPASKEFGGLVSAQESLVRITLPGDRRIEVPKSIQVEAPGVAQSPAQLVSPSPQADPAVQGRSYFFRTPLWLPAGMRIVARLPTSPQALEGFLIPDSAVIWYGNEPWAFVQESPERFVRRPVRGQPVSTGGLFVTDGFKPEERVVVAGAQLLHSEELRPKTAGASGCKDPECD
jgi:hypothetical protein